jgi:hypothetical protein
MPRRKVTFVYDPETRRNMWEPQPLEEVVAGWVGVWDVTVEEMPDPPVRQRFIAEYTGDPGVGLLKASQVRARLREERYRDGTWTVTEVTDA